jgi:hypothetical protein
MPHPLEQNVSRRVVSILSVITLIAFLPLLLFATYQSVILITRAVGTKAVIVIDTKTILEPIRSDFYHAFAQGGEEPNDMIRPVLSEIRTLNPKIIRIDHIFDYYDVVSKKDGFLTYSFSKLDTVVDSIQATGATPLLSLSYMPSVIAKDGVITNPPNDWNEWAQVIQKTIEHYSGKNEKNIPGLYYEVWNEPDLDQFGSWKLTGEKNYLTLYHYAATGATASKNVQPFFLGGPSTTGLYKNWVIGLAKSDDRVDFYSWHSYLSDPKRFSSDQKNFVSWLIPFPNQTLKPTLITEFGLSGAKSSSYGTMYGAAYTASVIRQLISGGPTYLFSFELVDGPGDTTGQGWGLLTHPNQGKIKKPRYFVYSFLDDMVGNRLQLTGEGTWVTGYATIRENIISTLLINFDASGLHIETVPITWTGLNPGSYQMTTHCLNEKEHTVSVTVPFTGIWEKKLYMPAQSVCKITLKKV